MWGIVKFASILFFEIQTLFAIACLTFHFFLIYASYIRGATSLGFTPWRKGESQKGAIFPFTIVVVVAGSKRSISTLKDRDVA
jgi:hypothetical protein